MDKLSERLEARATPEAIRLLREYRKAPKFSNDHDAIKRTVALEDEIDAFLAAPPPSVPECAWALEEDGEAWDGACGARWQFTSDGPVQNDMRYCPCCGGRVIAAAPSAQEPPHV